MSQPPFTRAQLNACSTKRPIAPASYSRMLIRVHLSIDELQRGNTPTESDWAELASITNVMLALKEQGHVADERDTNQVSLIDECVSALAVAKLRVRTGANYRLTGTGLRAIKDLTEDFTTCLVNLPERAIKRAYNYVHNAQQHTSKSSH